MRRGLVLAALAMFGLMSAQHGGVDAGHKWFKKGGGGYGCGAPGCAMPGGYGGCAAPGCGGPFSPLVAHYNPGNPYGYYGSFGHPAGNPYGCANYAPYVYSTMVGCGGCGMPMCAMPTCGGCGAPMMGCGGCGGCGMPGMAPQLGYGGPMGGPVGGPQLGYGGPMGAPQMGYNPAVGGPVGAPQMSSMPLPDYYAPQAPMSTPIPSIPPVGEDVAW